MRYNASVVVLSSSLAGRELCMDADETKQRLFLIAPAFAELHTHSSTWLPLTAHSSD